MKILKISVLTIFFLSVILVSCKKEHSNPPLTPHSGPAMRGVSAVVNADGSVTLTGVINWIPDSLQVYGFELRTDTVVLENLLYENATAKPVVGTFTVNISAGSLLPNKKYYCTPFYTIYASKDAFGYYPAWWWYNYKTFTTGN